LTGQDVPSYSLSIPNREYKAKGKLPVEETGLKKESLSYRVFS
jgi:hypothetical protein